MGHCGNSPQKNNPNQEILSLRQPRNIGTQTWWEPHATFIWNKNGYLGEMKGKQNNKPVPSLHPYIVALLKLPMIKGVVGGGYKPQNNFKLSDLSPEMYQDLIAARPDFSKHEHSAKVDEIISILELDEDAWVIHEGGEEEDGHFIVQKWDTGKAYLYAAVGYDGRDVIDLYTGEDNSDPPHAKDIVELFESESEDSQYDWKTQKRVHNPNYLRNMTMEVIYENSRAVPEDFDINDTDSIEQLIDNASDDGKNLVAYYRWNRRNRGNETVAPPKPTLSAALETAVDIYSITQPGKHDADSEVDDALEYLNQEHSEWGTEIEYNGVNDPAYQTLPYDKAVELATQVEKMGKQIPNWDRDVSLPIGGDWYTSDSYGDYLQEQLDEHFSEEPYPPPGFQLPDSIRKFPGRFRPSRSACSLNQEMKRKPSGKA